MWFSPYLGQVTSLRKALRKGDRGILPLQLAHGTGEA